MIPIDELQAIVDELASRPGHEKVRASLHRLLVGGLGVESRQIDFEKSVPEVHGRIDALLGRTVFELKSDLRRELRDAESALVRYLGDRQDASGQDFVGIATDGSEFLVYVLDDDSVRRVRWYKIDSNNPDSLLPWLQGVVATGEELTPTHQAIRDEFGSTSLASNRALARLSEVWEQIEHVTEVRLKKELWKRLLGLAYGTSEVGSDHLFLCHTYLVVVAKSVAWSVLIDSPPSGARALLHGDAFHSLGIVGQKESDFFTWIVDVDGGNELVMRIWRHVTRFRWSDANSDVLKVVYEGLIDPDTRHDLGEYYTPDWLARRIVQTTIEDPLKSRVLDPSCGSGTFLFHVIRQIFRVAQKEGVSAAETVEVCTSNVIGLDIHPVAVVFARVTYLLALQPIIRLAEPCEISVPVYLGDAMQWDLSGEIDEGNQRRLFASDNTMNVVVPSLTVEDPKPRRLDREILHFPTSIVEHITQFDQILDKMIEMEERGLSVKNFIAWIRRNLDIPRDDRAILRETYMRLRVLRNQGRNHVWGYIGRNLARPMWLSTAKQKVDIIIGNPPWVSYRYMSGKFQDRFRSEMLRAGLWTGGSVATQQDLSAYFYMNSARLYLRHSGVIAMIMPYASMSRKAFLGFRRGRFSRPGSDPIILEYTSAWKFGPRVHPLFPVPSCVLFARIKTNSILARLPTHVLDFVGTLPSRDVDNQIADQYLDKRSITWPRDPTDGSSSAYRKSFRNGAILVPRRLVLVDYVKLSRQLPPNQLRPFVRGRKTNLDKLPWKSVAPPDSTVEREFIRPVYLGESVVPFRCLEPLHAVIPWDTEKHDLMDSKAALDRGYAEVSSWLEKVEDLWESNKSSNMTYLEQIDYYGKLTVQFPVNPLRIVYTKAGKRPVACIVSDTSAVIDHKLYWAPIDSEEEGHYLCSLINSKTVQSRVKEYQSVGQWGARDIDKYVFKLPIPRYDPADKVHSDLAKMGANAEDIARAVPVKKADHFVKARRQVRAALKVHECDKEIESLVLRLLG